MPPPPIDSSRPSMRRKSSAQNILSTFKSSSNAAASTTATSSSSSGAVGASSTSHHHHLATTPTTALPMGRDWDVSTTASGSDTVTLASTTSSPATGPQGTSVEYLRDLVQKRIITLTYMRNVHEGRSHWFHTILMSRAELDKVFNNSAMKKRTYRFAILGMSLSNLLDIQQPYDLLRGTTNIMTEYEQSKEEGEKPKKRLFSKDRPRKRHLGGNFTDYLTPYSDGSDTSFLVSPHIPFPLDYHQTLLSLLSVLSSVYAKMLKILGPSPFSGASHLLSSSTISSQQPLNQNQQMPQPQHMMGPLGALSPHPGVSYLFEGGEGGVVGGSLWAIANAGSGGGVGTSSGVNLGSPPVGWTPALGEMMLKVDVKFKKITSTLLKELDAFARNSMKDELATFDPLLRNVSVADDRREQYDFERLL